MNEEKINLRILTEAYQPESIISRDEQIKEIQQVFNLFKDQGAVKNKLIQGCTGSGKTATVKHIITNENGLILFASGTICKTSQQILNSLTDSNYRNKSQVLMKLIEQLKKNPKVIIIDEIHKIRDYKDLMQDLNSVYREAHTPIMIITNKRMFLNELEEDIKRTLFFRRIEFKAYNAVELKKILDSRLGLANAKIPDGTKNYICGKGAKMGSARLVLDLAYECLSENKFTQKFVMGSITKMEDDEWEDFIKGIPESEKEVLKLILDIHSQKGIVYTYDLLKELKQYTPSRLSHIITNIENYDIIQPIRTKLINKGRAGGRFRSIEFVSESVYENLLKLI